MKSELEIKDPIAGEDDGLGRELFGALGALRPEPDGFRAAVGRGIEAGGQRDPEPGSGDELHSEVPVPDFVRRAAAFLPPALLPKGLAQLGAGGALATKASFKFLPGVLAFPVISILMVFVTLGLGLRTLLIGAGGRQETHESQARIEASAWWRRFWLPTLLVGGVGAYWLFEEPAGGLMLLLMGSTLALLGVFSSLAKSGLATRVEVGRRAAGTLMGLVAIAIQLLPGMSLGVEGANGWSVLVLLVGAAICLGLASRAQPDEGFDKRLIPILLFGAVVLYASFGGRGAGFLRPHVVSTSDAVAWLESGAGVEQVDEAAQVLSNLEAAGLGPFELGPLEDAIHARLDAEGDSFNSLYAAAMIRLGGFREGDYARLRDEQEVDAAAASSGRRFINVRALEPALLVELHRSALDQAARARLGELVLDNVDASDRYTGTDDIERAARLLVELGQSERLGELAEAAEVVLRATWAPTRNGRQGAFASYRDTIDRDAEGHSIESSLTLVWVDSTAIGVRLLERFGVPEGIDLEALDRYLAEQSIGRSDPRADDAEAAASRELLHQLPEWRASSEQRRPGLLEQLLEARTFLAALLAALLAVGLTLRAPARTR